VSEPLRFVFGLHLHQPVGNFDFVFEQHVRDVYEPFLARADEAGLVPLVLHISGSLLEWLESHPTVGAPFLDRVGRMAADGRVELLLAGMYEPILASLPRRDRAEQIAWLREALLRRFGVAGDGLWLTERVWEPDLAADLAAAGVRYALVDDRHFLVCGFAPEQLHQPWRTEHDGAPLALLPIDERLRYLVPFREPVELAAYLRTLRAAGRPLAVLADDGEKFGGWPGTLDWIWRQGWFARFAATLRELVDAGEVRLVTGAAAVAEVPSGGLAYLPTASYREMETWSLPGDAAARLVRLEESWGHDRLHGLEGPLLRGAHWRNFLAKYHESNRLHKMMVALSRLCRERGDPPDVRRAIGRAQCNDAYWHGVFGGLYLPVLRSALWHQLAVAERELRRGEPLVVEQFDLDADGHDELWVHGESVSVVVSPRRGGAVEVFMRLQDGENLADALTRRREAYHETAVAAAAEAGEYAQPGAPGGPEIERQQRAPGLPPVDACPRALFQDHVLPGALTIEGYTEGHGVPLRTWAAEPMAATVEAAAHAVAVRFTADGFEKRLEIGADGALAATYRWDPAEFPDDAVFAVELSLSRDVGIVCTPPADLWRYEIETVAKSERGLERVRQGTAILARWPAKLGAARLEIPAS